MCLLPWRSEHEVAERPRDHPACARVNLGLEALDQPIARRGCADRCERESRRAADGPEPVLLERGLERALGGGAAALGELVGGRDAIDRERGLCKLGDPHRLGLVDLARREELVARIEDRLGRFAVEAKMKRLALLDDLDRHVDILVADPEAHARRQPEHAGSRVHVLRLLDHHGRHRGIGIPADRDRELGMAGTVDHPLAEEPIDDLAGRVFDRACEIARLDEPEPMLGQVVRERLPERVVAEMVAQHVQRACALLVEMVIEDVDRLVVQLGRDRAAIAVGVLAEIRVAPVLELEICRIPTLVVFAPDVFRVGREALVEPALAPIAARH